MEHDPETVDDGIRGLVLADGARWGERFVAHLGTPSGPQWCTAAELFTDGDALTAALERVGRARGAPSAAVTATLLLDGYAQRLVAPVLGALYLVDRVLDADLAAVRVSSTETGFGRMAFAADPRPRGSASDDDARRAVRSGLVQGHLATAVDVLHRRTRAGTRTLWGTVANACASTFLHLSWPDPDRARFVDAARAFLAGDPDLVPLVTVTALVEGGERWMYTDRATCCLAFRTTVNRERAQRYCATCPVVPSEETRTLFRDATASYRARQADR